MSAEALEAPFDGKNVFSRCFVEGTRFASHVDGLADGRQRVLDRLNANLISLAVRAGPDSGGKAGDDEGVVDGGDGFEVWVDPTVRTIFTPFVPVFLVGLGSLVSDSICCRSVRKQEITRDAQFVGRVDSIQEPVWSGKFALKKEVRCLDAAKYSPVLNALDATSAMVLSSPAMLTGMMEDVCRIRCRTNRKRRSWAAARDLLVWPL